jgi:hypothetical protein
VPENAGAFSASEKTRKNLGHLFAKKTWDLHLERRDEQTEQHNIKLLLQLISTGKKMASG